MKKHIFFHNYRYYFGGIFVACILILFLTIPAYYQLEGSILKSFVFRERSEMIGTGINESLEQDKKLAEKEIISFINTNWQKIARDICHCEERWETFGFDIKEDNEVVFRAKGIRMDIEKTLRFTENSRKVNYEIIN